MPAYPDRLGPEADGPHAGNGHRPAAADAPQAHSTQPRTFEVTAVGEGTLRAFGMKIETLRRARRRFAGECLDWTEREPHLNGALGAAMTARLLELGWLERGLRRRAVRVTPAGRDGLAATFGWPVDE